MKTNKQNLGQRGEDMAVEYLQSRGLKIICRNFRFGRGELDIICNEDKDLVIVEVKSVRRLGYGSGEERISLKKQREIIRTTYAYLDRCPIHPDQGVRFDVVIVDFTKYPVSITHYRAALWQQ